MNIIFDKVIESLDIMLDNWKRMQAGTMDDPDGNADNAEIFETNFYRFIDLFRVWFESLDKKPETLEAALEVKEIDGIIELLPAPLYLPFETELDLIVEGKNRTSDEKYD